MKSLTASFRSLSDRLPKALHACALIALGLAVSPVALADTMVAGAISANTHWTASGSPYVVTDDLTINNDAVLSIDAGVTVYMQQGTGLSVQKGGIQALGKADNPIRVLSDQVRQGLTAAPGDFGSWTFAAGTANTKLEHLVFENGSGLVVQGAAPVFNYVDIRNNSGAAITIDLAASLSGVGNRASGNALNGIAVPPGDVVGSVKWALRGVPYVVQAGTVSVGASPRVTQVSPAVVERGQTQTVTVDGSRLDGLASATIDRTGVTITPFAGGTSSRVSFQFKIATDAQLGAASLRLQLDAGELIVPNAISISQPIPVVSSITPTSVYAGSGVNEIVVTGRNFNAQAEVLVNSAAIPTQFVNGTELRASLPNQTSASTMPVQVRIPDSESSGQYITSTTSAILTVQMPVPPTVAFEPTPIAMPPDNKPHEIVMRLSKADFRDHTLSLSLSDPSKASLNPTTVTIVAGQTTARVAITPLAQGSTTLTAQSATLGETKVPLFITPDFNGVNTSYAPMVGVVIERAAKGTPVDVTVAQQGSVGVGVGATLTTVSPRGWKVGSEQTFVIRGFGIPAGSRVAVVPLTGMTVGASVVSPDGTTLTVPIRAAENAQPGMHRLVVLDGNGALLTFADAASPAVYLAGGDPQLESVSPIAVTPGSLFALTVRGRNLQGGRLQISPADGIAVDAEPQISADGTQMTAQVHVTETASLGDKVVRVTTPSGASGADAVPGNTLRVVSSLGAQHLTAAPVVGVLVGSATPAPTSVEVPLPSSDVGLVVGTSVTDVLPRTGVIGTTVTVTVHGQGLRDVASVSFTPSTGLTVGAPAIDDDGKRLTFDVSIAPDAALGLRRLALKTATVPLAFADAMDGAFLVSAPLAELDSVSPQVVKTGSTGQGVTIRGRNLTNASDIRFVPANGIAVNRPFTINADGTQLDFSITVDAAANAGTRTLVVVTPAGESTSESLPGNSLQLATQIGATYDSISAPLVGVQVGATGGAGSDWLVLSPDVGVVVETPPPASVTADRHVASPAVSVLIGSAATGMTPKGWLQGSAGTITVTGVGLDQVTGVSVTPSEGLLLDARTVNAAGTELNVPLSVAPGASLVQRRLHLSMTTGELVWVDLAEAVFGIGKVPSMNSLSPIVITSGTATTLSVRGTGLQNVNGAALMPDDGVTVVGTPVWSTDEYGELLQITVSVDAEAATGDRVLQLLVPGGATSATPSPANTVKVVKP